MPKYLMFILLGSLFLLISIPAYIVQDARLESTQDEAIASSRKVKVLLHDENKVVEMPIEQYLVGVVAAEMPASFEKEALKAQAITARTYTMKRIAQKKDKHYLEADICTDYKHCQAWESTAQLKKKWGFLYYNRNIKKIKQAVAATKDLVIVYQGNLIDPLYHSSCGGNKTEDAEEVWGNYQPYLRSVKCDWDENNKKETISFSLKKFASLVVSLNGYQNSDIKSEENSSGRVRYFMVGNYKISGVELRKKLGLKSTLFSWQLDSQKITFSTIGYGHGVGLCQYGANGMAKAGDNYEQIITHYFTGVKIVKINKG